MAIARPVDSGDKKPRVEKHAGNAARASRAYLVDTTNMAEALMASGLPGDDAPFDSSALGQTIRLARLRWEKGGGETGSARTGFSWVIAEYETDGFGGKIEPKAKLGGDWTEISTRQDSLTVAFGLNDNEEPFGDPINMGSGVSKSVGRHAVKVHLFKTVSQAQIYPWGLLVNAATMQALNKHPVALPPLNQKVPLPQFAADTLKMIGFSSSSVTGDLVELVIELEWAADFDVIWTNVDDNGQPVSTGIARIYERLDYAGCLA